MDELASGAFRDQLRRIISPEKKLEYEITRIRRKYKDKMHELKRQLRRMRRYNKPLKRCIKTALTFERTMANLRHRFPMFGMPVFLVDFSVRDKYACITQHIDALADKYHVVRCEAMATWKWASTYEKAETTLRLSYDIKGPYFEGDTVPKNGPPMIIDYLPLKRMYLSRIFDQTERVPLEVEFECIGLIPKNRRLE